MILPGTPYGRPCALAKTRARTRKHCVFSRFPLPTPKSDNVHFQTPPPPHHAPDPPFIQFCLPDTDVPLPCNAIHPRFPSFFQAFLRIAFSPRPPLPRLITLARPPRPLLQRFPRPIPKLSVPQISPISTPQSAPFRVHFLSRKPPLFSQSLIRRAIVSEHFASHRRPHSAPRARFRPTPRCKA
jgi:hypothetical protein